MEYKEILQQFKKDVPGTRAIVFCDHEGEAIEYVSDFDSYHTQLLGAYQSELLFNLNRASENGQAGAIASFAVCAKDATISAWPVATGYYLAVMSKRPLPMSHPAVQEVTRRLRAEL